MSRKQIAVFRTNVHDEPTAIRLAGELAVYMPGCRITFDLDDCDRVLRIEGKDAASARAIAVLAGHGFDCSPLTD